MKRLGTVLLATSLCLVATGIVSGEHRGGGGGPAMGGGGGGRGGSHAGGRPFMTGIKQDFAAAAVPGGAFASGIRGGFPGAYGYGGLGGVGFLGAGFGFGGGYGYGFSESTLLYRLGHIPVPPYYALHPPVYYGQRIFRSYGDSPFANYPTPAAYRQPAAAQWIQNPLVPVISVGGSGAAAVPAPDQTAQLIVNPFYDGPTQQVASASEAAR
ncbi:MAG: hypothetical protein J5I93_13290 [Pirellulaceae bacterium]|nr:hypothetical protein [Pirellulaceae bacterium]